MYICVFLIRHEQFSILVETTHMRLQTSSNPNRLAFAYKTPELEKRRIEQTTGIKIID